jgi:serine/threonine-protein kinase
MSFIPDSVVRHLRRNVSEPAVDPARYRVKGLVGRGGMGVVWKVEDLTLGRVVALKTLDAAADDPQLAERLRREVRMLAPLEHPNIVPLYDAGELGDGRVFYTMRLVEGPTLAEYARTQATVPDRVRKLLSVCDAVAFAHSRGVVHRDLKPANVVTGPFGEVFVLDWGIASALGSGAAAAGTLDYMSPEQVRGAGDERADIYSLGVILRELVAGKPAPRRLCAIAAKASHPDPEPRYRQVEELTADLRRYLDGEPVSAHREALWETASRWAGNNKVLLVLLASYIVVRTAMFFLRRG